MKKDLSTIKKYLHFTGFSVIIYRQFARALTLPMWPKAWQRGLSVLPFPAAGGERIDLTFFSDGYWFGGEVEAPGGLKTKKEKTKWQ